MRFPAFLPLFLFLSLLTSSDSWAARAANGDTAATLWAVVFNDSGACVDGCNADDIAAADGAVIYVAGGRVQSNGRIILAGAISNGSSLGQAGGPGAGLVDETKEVHFVVQTHGTLAEMRLSRHIQTTQDGVGCNTACANLQFAVFLDHMVGEVPMQVIPSGDSVSDATAYLERIDGEGIVVSVDTRI